jgi:heme-degrading monooxygenase HmoA
MASSEREGSAPSVVIEIVTFRLAAGTSVAGFKTLDRAVELQHVAKQPGFISRESAAGDNGEWLVVVHWRSVRDAEASMASFASAPAAQSFMAQIDAPTMTMRRYVRP